MSKRRSRRKLTEGRREEHREGLLDLPLAGEWLQYIGEASPTYENLETAVRSARSPQLAETVRKAKETACRNLTQSGSKCLRTARPPGGGFGCERYCHTSAACHKWAADLVESLESSKSVQEQLNINESSKKLLELLEGSPTLQELLGLSEWPKESKYNIVHHQVASIPVARVQLRLFYPFKRTDPPSAVVVTFDRASGRWQNNNRIDEEGNFPILSSSEVVRMICAAFSSQAYKDAPAPMKGNVRVDLADESERIKMWESAKSFYDDAVATTYTANRTVTLIPEIGDPLFTGTDSLFRGIDLSTKKVVGFSILLWPEKVASVYERIPQPWDSKTTQEQRKLSLRKQLPGLENQEYITI